VIIYHLTELGGVALISNLTVFHVDHALGMNGKHVFHAVFHNHDRQAFVRQLPECQQRFMRGGRVQAGKRFIQQQDFGLHRQHTGQRHFLLFASGSPKGFFITQVQNVQPFQRFFAASDHF